MTAVTNATEFCVAVENALGWEPVVKPGSPPYKRYMAEAGKLKRKIKTDEALYTWDNLLLAVIWLQRQRKTVTPTGVCWFVAEALKEAPEVEAKVNTDASALIFGAITEAMVAGEPEWVERLARATGSARADVLTEWNSRG